MKEEVYYKAVEFIDDGKYSLSLTYPKGSKYEFSRKFKTYNDAEEAVRKGIRDRKNQYSYFRDLKTDEIVDKISYYNQHKLEYKIYKVKEVSELLYSEDNSQAEMKKADKELQEEIPLTL